VLSGSFQAASIAAANCPEGRIALVDSQLASIATGIPVIEGAIAARKGASLAEVASLVEHLCRNTRVFFAVDTLEYLYRNGRIGRASHLLGSLLSMKPVLTLQDGLVVAYDKVRGRRKALSRMTEALKESFPGARRLRLGVAHAQAQDDLQTMLELLRDAFGEQDVLISDVGAVIGTHTGPGTMAVVCTALE
jgi:DegV family protein with EDD domain